MQFIISSVKILIYLYRNIRRGTLPSVNVEPKGYKTSGENKSPKRRLDRRRSERLIGNYTSDSRHQFSRQQSISEDLPMNTSSSNFRPDKQNYNNNDVTTVPEWLRKNPLQLNYINNCDRNHNNVKNKNRYNSLESEDYTWSNSMRNETGIFY